jgi:DNA (cytosine-5)-methyltransferase 1
MILLMIAIDLFCGAGGLSMGATTAGIRVIAAVESDPHAAKTYAHNHPGVRVINRSIESIKLADFPTISRRQPLIIFGGPPCQGFSTSNQRTRNTTNTKNWLYREFARIVRLLEPDFVLFENVTGITQTASGVFLENVKSSLNTLGFHTMAWILNAADYGVPQRRSRLFLVGCRTHKDIAPPPAISGTVTLSEAIGDLPTLQNGASISRMQYKNRSTSQYAQRLRGNSRDSPNHLVTRNNALVLKRYSHVPQGGNWESIPKQLMKNYADRSRCHEWIYRRLRSEEPSVVIGNYRKNMLIHPTEDRGLSVREAARIQSFPDAFEFFGSIGFQQQQVGNAVPPRLAQAVFETIVTFS